MIKYYIARRFFPELSYKEFKMLWLVYYVQADELKFSKNTIERRLSSCAEKLNCNINILRKVFFFRIKQGMNNAENLSKVD